MTTETTEPHDPERAVAAPAELPAHALPWSVVADHLDVDVATGLTGAQVSAREMRDGPNELPQPTGPSTWRRFAAQFRSWLVLVLAVAAALALVVGEYLDAGVIAGVLVLNAALGFVQERRAAASIAALEGLLANRAEVRRDGGIREIPASELVVGDLVALDAGDRVPADGRLISATNLTVDESSLTGESVPVDKDPEASLAQDVAVADRATMVWMNTTVARGRAWLLVTATGARTEVGRLAVLLAEAEPPPTPLQQQLDRLGRRLVAIAGVAVAIVLGLALLQGATPVDAAMDAIALAIAAIPEGLPAVVTLTLAVGGSHLARQQAIARRLTAVETLGATEVICTDKTGTLTRNEMTVTVVWRAGREHRVTGTGYGLTGEVQPPVDLGRAAGVLVRCNDATVDDGQIVGDPTEASLLVLAAKAGVDLATLRARPRLDEVPFDAATKLMATSHLDVTGGRGIEVKGAPDVVLTRCTTWFGPDGVEPLTPQDRLRIEEEIARLAQQGLRTLGLATRRLSLAPGATSSRAGGPLDEAISELTFEGLVGIVDPPRSGVHEAVATAQRAGIRVIMVTGDHPGTAAAIAREVGIHGEVVTGAQLDTWDDATLAERLRDLGVCARVDPGHKVRLVRVLQSQGEVTAMTGDGVNDAPALQRADIGVAMGRTGTEVTKQAADLVLADDDFSTIVRAVERGRAIYDNLVAFIRFQLATNVGAITLILAARLAGLPAPFTPIQLLWVNLIMDGPPALALGVDPARRDTMSRPPRDEGTQILDRRRLGPLLLSGAVMAAGTLGVYAGALANGVGTPVAVTWAFTTFVLFQVGNALNARVEQGTVFSRHTLTNRALWVALAGVVLLQVAAVHLSVIGRALDTVALTLGQWAVAVLVALSVILVEETRKLVVRRLALPAVEVEAPVRSPR